MILSWIQLLTLHIESAFILFYGMPLEHGFSDWYGDYWNPCSMQRSIIELTDKEGYTFCVLLFCFYVVGVTRICGARGKKKLAPPYFSVYIFFQKADHLKTCAAESDKKKITFHNTF